MDHQSSGHPLVVRELSERAGWSFAFGLSGGEDQSSLNRDDLHEIMLLGYFVKHLWTLQQSC